VTPLRDLDHQLLSQGMEEFKTGTGIWNIRNDRKIKFNKLVVNKLHKK